MLPVKEIAWRRRARAARLRIVAGPGHAGPPMWPPETEVMMAQVNAAIARSNQKVMGAMARVISYA